MNRNITEKTFLVGGKEIKMVTTSCLGSLKSEVRTENGLYTITHGKSAPGSKNGALDNGNRWVSVINEEEPEFSAKRSHMIAFRHGDEECIRAILAYEAGEVENCG